MSAYDSVMAKLAARIAAPDWTWQQAEHAFYEDHPFCASIAHHPPIVRGLLLELHAGSAESDWIRKENRSGELVINAWLGHFDQWSLGQTPNMRRVLKNRVTGQIIKEDKR